MGNCEGNTTCAVSDAYQERILLSPGTTKFQTTPAVLERDEIPSMYTLLKQRRLRWLGHVVRMDDGRIPKDLLYGELAQAKRPTGRPQLRYKDVCKRDLKALGIDINGRESLASNRSAWRQAVQQGLLEFEEALAEQAETKRQTRKARNQGDRPATDHICSL